MRSIPLHFLIIWLIKKKLCLVDCSLTATADSYDVPPVTVVRSLGSHVNRVL